MDFLPNIQLFWVVVVVLLLLMFLISLNQTCVFLYVFNVLLWVLPPSLLSCPPSLSSLPSLLPSPPSLPLESLVSPYNNNDWESRSTHIPYCSRHNFKEEGRREHAQTFLIELVNDKGRAEEEKGRGTHTRTRVLIKKKESKEGGLNGFPERLPSRTYSKLFDARSNIEIP